MRWNHDPYRPGAPTAAATAGPLGSDIDRIPREQYVLRTLAETVIDRTNDDPLRIMPRSWAIASMRFAYVVTRPLGVWDGLPRPTNRRRPLRWVTSPARLRNGPASVSADLIGGVLVGW